MTAPTPFIPAWSVTPCELTFDPGSMSAIVSIVARLIATAAPMPTLDGPDASPLATAFASACIALFSVSEPPVVIEIWPGTTAFASTSAMFTATPAATLTPPLEVDAEGVLDADEARPGPAAAFAWLRSPATWLSTPPPAAPDADGEASPGAPRAPALASASVSEVASASNVAEPPATRFRSVWASD